MSSAPPHRLHTLEFVLASLALLSVQPRRASKESITKQELAHFTELDSAIVLHLWSMTTITH